MRRLVLIALALLAGCGGAEPTASEPFAPVEVAATTAQSATLTRVVAKFDRAYRRGDGEAVCALITPLTQTFIVDFVGSARPVLRDATCAEIVTSETFTDPADLPPAVEEASTRKFERVTVTPDGHGATISFSDCRRWRLVLQGDAWLMHDFPLMPRSLRDVGRDCAATDRSTA